MQQCARVAAIQYWLNLNFSTFIQLREFNKPMTTTPPEVISLIVNALFALHLLELNEGEKKSKK